MPGHGLLAGQAGAAAERESEGGADAQYVGMAALFQEGAQCRARAIALITGYEVQAYTVRESIAQQVDGQLAFGGEG